MLSVPTRLLRDRRLVVATVALVLVGALLVGFGHWGRSDPEAATPVVDQGSTRCADALILGVNGNRERHAGRHGYGPTVDSVVKRVVAKAERRGRHVSVRALPLRTQGPATVLKKHRTPSSRADRVVSKHGLRHWRATVVAGVRDARALLATATAKCPDRPVLLVGYAQGAAVVHRVLARTAAEGGLSALIGGILISDPDRVSRSAARPVLGAPPAYRRHEGLFPHVLSASSDVPAGQGSYAVWSVCTRYDLVCDPSRAPVRQALAVAHSYAGSRTLRDVAQAAWKQLALWPVPTPRTQVYTGAVGVAVHLQLDVAPGTYGSVVWTEAAGLPKGVTLSSSGLLSGTPARSGTFDVSYRTSNTRPATTGHTGSLLLKITPASVSLSAGGQTTCLTRSDGTARCWGRNDYGQVGDGTKTRRDAPAKVATQRLGLDQHQRLQHLRGQGERHPVVLGAQQLRAGRDRDQRAGQGAAPGGHPLGVGLGLERLEPHLRHPHRRHPVVLGAEPLRPARHRLGQPRPPSAAACRGGRQLAFGHRRGLAHLRAEQRRDGVLLGPQHLRRARRRHGGQPHRPGAGRRRPGLAAAQHRLGPDLRDHRDREAALLGLQPPGPAR